VRQQVAGKAAAGSSAPVKQRKRLTGGPRWIFIFERKVKSAVFWFAPNASFQTLKNVDKFSGDRVWCREQLLLLKLPQIQIQIWIEIQGSTCVLKHFEI
jgi:hypothetical protein